MLGWSLMTLILITFLTKKESFYLINLNNIIWIFFLLVITRIDLWQGFKKKKKKVVVIFIIYLSILLITGFYVWISTFCILKYSHTNS